MKKELLIILLFSLFVTYSCSNHEVKTEYAATLLMDSAYLASAKNRIQNNDPTLKFAFDRLMKEADKALKEGPFSVTDKEKLPPSGNKHDYASYSRYWWPDATKPDGLPYIWRDGETNPDSQSLQYSDRQRIGAFGRNTETLALAYYLTGNEKYAKKAAELLRVWFLNEETKMNPNVNHSQIRLGHNNGTKSGVLDGRLMIHAFEGALLIKGSSALSDTEQKELKQWAAMYFEWLTTSELALKEADSKNNHGSFYDVQAMYFALYSGNKAAATQIAQRFIEKRLYAQIEPDGAMPKEMARTRPLFYSIYNLHAMFVVAHLAQKVNVDIWNAGEETSRLKTALDYLVPYADSNKPWPHPTIGETDRMKLYNILQMADRAYPNQNYLEKATILPLEKRKVLRSNIGLPLIR